MAQRPDVRAGITEGHIPKLHIILTIRPLFGGEAPLIHGIGNVQKCIDGLEKFSIGLHMTDGAQQQGGVAGKCGHSADILGHAADAEGTAQRLQAYEQIHNAGENSG